MLQKNVKTNQRLAYCNLQKDEPRVQSNLALTPAKMWAKAQQGEPISASSLPDDYFEDGEAYADYNIPIDRQRGIDVVQCWEASKNSKGKIKNLQNNIKSIKHGQETI